MCQSVLQCQPLQKKFIAFRLNEVFITEYSLRAKVYDVLQWKRYLRLATVRLSR
jgi:hypothetical protein